MQIEPDGNTCRLCSRFGVYRRSFAALYRIKWGGNNISVFELNDKVHEFHDGISRELYKRSRAQPIDTDITPAADIAGLIMFLARLLAIHYDIGLPSFRFKP